MSADLGPYALPELFTGDNTAYTLVALSVPWTYPFRCYPIAFTTPKETL